MRTSNDLPTIPEQSLTTICGGVTTIADSLRAIRDDMSRSLQQGQAMSAQIRNAQSATLSRDFTQRSILSSLATAR
jgi:hypothetical protein